MHGQQRAEQDRPPGPGVRADEPACQHRDVERVAVQQRVEELGREAVGDDQPGGEQEEGEHAQVPIGDQRLEREDGAQRDRERRDHAETREQRRGQERDGLQRVVPARLQRAREHHRGAGLQRDDDDDAEQRQRPVGLGPALPMRRRAAPAARGDAVDLRAQQAALLCLRVLESAVAQRREVRQQADIPEGEGDHQKADDVDRVPVERAAELRPQPERVRVGQIPVEKPRPPEMNDRIGARGGRGDDRHRLGDPVDAAAPFDAEQHERRGGEHPAAGDADPPIVGNDIERPRHRDVVAPDAGTEPEQPSERHGEQPDQRRGDAHREPPA